MDGFSGFKTAATEELPDAVTVMDPFHVVRLAGNALDECRRRVQLATCGHRGRKADPLYRARRTLHTGADLLTDKQKARLAALFAVDAHAEVEATWTMYQRTVAAYREPDRTKGRTMMAALIATLSTGVPKPLQELITLGRTLKKRAADVLAYFDRPGTSNGPTEAINGRLEHLRDPPSDFVTSPTTSPDHYWKPADSGLDYTLNHEEPGNQRVTTAEEDVRALTFDEQRCVTTTYLPRHLLIQHEGRCSAFRKGTQSCRSSVLRSSWSGLSSEAARVSVPAPSTYRQGSKLTEESPSPRWMVNHTSA